MLTAFFKIGRSFPLKADIAWSEKKSFGMNLCDRVLWGQFRDQVCRYTAHRVSQMWMYRRIGRVSWKAKKTNKEVLNKLGLH